MKKQSLGTLRPLCSSRQQGFSLVMVMIIMVIVSMIGVGASQMVLQAERSSRYDRDAQIAYQAAEAALIDAEFDIRGPNASAASRMDLFSPLSRVGFADGCGVGGDRGLCSTPLTGKAIWFTVDFTDESVDAHTVKLGDFTGRTWATGTAGAQPAAAPRYIIEVIPDLTAGTSSSNNTQPLLHRVTAVGFGPRKETQVVLQMIIRKVSPS